MALFATLVTASCKDDRPAFEAFLACNDAMKIAATEKAMLSCYTKQAAQTISSDRFGDIEPWLETERKSRPPEPRLFREVPSEAGSTLLIVNGNGPTSYSRHIVEMVRSRSGAWQIASWQTTGTGGLIEDPNAPIALSLSVDGALQWTGVDLWSSGFSGKNCTFAISDVFGTANVNFPVNCPLLTQPGVYSAAEFLPSPDERQIYVSIEGSGGVERSVDATLNVAEASGGLVTGDFVINIDGAKGKYTVTGSYANIPYSERATE